MIDVRNSVMLKAAVLEIKKHTQKMFKNCEERNKQRRRGFCVHSQMKREYVCVCVSLQGKRCKSLTHGSLARTWQVGARVQVHLRRPHLLLLHQQTHLSRHEPLVFFLVGRVGGSTNGSGCHHTRYSTKHVMLSKSVQRCQGSRLLLLFSARPPI